MTIGCAPTLAVGFGQAITLGLKKYVTFNGRASRSEYWYFLLFYMILSIITRILDAAIGAPVLSTLLIVVAFIPLLSILIRRLHDIGRSGWWYLIWITVIGAFVLLYWLCQKGGVDDNQYGPGPVAQPTAS